MLSWFQAVVTPEDCVKPRAEKKQEHPAKSIQTRLFSPRGPCSPCSPSSAQCADTVHQAGRVNGSGRINDAQTTQAEYDPAAGRFNWSVLPSPSRAAKRLSRFQADEKVEPFRMSRFEESDKVESAANLKDLPEDFCSRLTDLCINDGNIVAQLHDEANCQLIWGEARSLRFRFLQNCIWDRWGACSAIWRDLGENQRRQFVSLYYDGVPSHDFFLELTLENEQREFMSVYQHGALVVHRGM